jgi:methylphosphotriester-DNA--protein-cysteine methyltransferase
MVYGSRRPPTWRQTAQNVRTFDHPAAAEAAGFRACHRLSARHLRRLFLAHLGVSPDQLARSRRAHFARRLLDDTDLTVVDVAFASGFGSLRQFNRTMREVFRASPTDLGLPAPAANWRPWLALAAAHLMAYGDTLVRDAVPV